jgi:hypothetical protein
MDSEPASQSERLPSLTHVPHKRCASQEPLGDILHHWLLVDVLRIKDADSCRYVCKRKADTGLSFILLRCTACLWHGELTPNSSVRLLFLLKSMLLLDALTPDQHISCGASCGVENTPLLCADGGDPWVRTPAE